MGELEATGKRHMLKMLQGKSLIEIGWRQSSFSHGVPLRMEKLLHFAVTSSEKIMGDLEAHDHLKAAVII